MTSPDKEFSKGEKCIKTGLFKWKPDYVSAAIHFEAAARGFEISGNSDGAIRAYNRLAEANDKMNDPWATARCHESLSRLHLRAQQVNKAIEHTDKAAELFRIHGSSDKALRLYMDVGRELQSNNLLEAAVKLYKKALSLVDSDQLYAYGKDVVNPYVSILIDHHNYDEALHVYEKELVFAQELARDHYIHKVALCIAVVTFLSKPDKVDSKVQEVISFVPSFLTSNEYQAFTDMLNAYYNLRHEEFSNASRRAVFNNLELLRQLRAMKIDPAEVERVRAATEKQELDFS